MKFIRRIIKKRELTEEEKMEKILRDIAPFSTLHYTKKRLTQEEIEKLYELIENLTTLEKGDP